MTDTVPYGKCCSCSDYTDLIACTLDVWSKGALELVSAERRSG